MGRSSGTTRKEERLLKKGEIHKLQKYRYHKTRTCTSQNCLPWDPLPSEITRRIPRFLQHEQKLREIAQREVALETKINRGSLSSARLEEIDEELLSLKSEYWKADQKWYGLREQFHCQYLKRALDLWRSEPTWYLHKVLCDDCVDRGGCCSRGCGCCRTRALQVGSTRQLAVGHCTVECGCCQDARGFALSEEAKGFARERYPFGPDEYYSTHSRFKRIMKASIFGIIKGSPASPFDHIDRPPEYSRI